MNAAPRGVPTMAIMAAVLLSVGCAARTPPSARVRPCLASTSAPEPSAWVPPRERGPKMIRIEGGEFEMGGKEECCPNASPPHALKVDTFFMDETEVTAGQYAQCVLAGVCEAQASVLWNADRMDHARKRLGDAALLKMENDSCTLFAKGHEDHPMNCVDWYQANRFCAWALKRLPTEAEWEYAARGPEGRKYPWGNEEPTPNHANICGDECKAEAKKYGVDVLPQKHNWNDGFPLTSPVRTFPAGRTPTGLWGIGGNASEWTSTKYCSYAGQPCMEQAYVIRGSAWESWNAHVSVRRGAGFPMLTYSVQGFRCVRTGEANLESSGASRPD